MDAIDTSIPKRLASWDFTIFWRGVLRPWEMLGAKHGTRKIQRISVSNGKMIYQLPTQKLEVPLVKSFPPPDFPWISVLHLGGNAHALQDRTTNAHIPQRPGGSGPNVWAMRT
jgi:hypothetical protein